MKSGEIDKVYSDMLARAETLRAKADYDVERQITEEEVKKVLEESEKFLIKVGEVIQKMDKIDH